jgi:hypothetical protein
MTYNESQFSLLNMINRTPIKLTLLWTSIYYSLLSSSQSFYQGE